MYYNDRKSRTQSQTVQPKGRKETNVGEFNGRYVELAHWARKDDRPYGARNLYRVCRETEKAILVNPVDGYIGNEDVTFWASKKAAKILTDEHGNFIA